MSTFFFSTGGIDKKGTENSIKINTVSLKNMENNLIIHVSNIVINW